MVAMHLRQPSKNSLLNTYVIDTGGVQVKRQARCNAFILEGKPTWKQQCKIRTFCVPAANLVLIKHDFHKDCSATSIFQMCLLDKIRWCKKAGRVTYLSTAEVAYGLLCYTLPG